MRRPAQSSFRRATAVGRRLLRQHGLTDWTVEVAELRTTGPAPILAATLYSCRTIVLDPLSLFDPDYTVRDVLLHEVAHALAGPRQGHGPEWQRLARRLKVPEPDVRSSALEGQR